MIRDHSDHGSGVDGSGSGVDSSVHLIYHDASDLGSLILIWIISKECTLSHVSSLS